MKKTVIAVLICLLGFTKIACAEGPAAAPASAMAPVISGSPAKAIPSGVDAGALMHALQGQSPATVQSNSPTGTNADLSTPQSTEGKTSTKTEGSKTEAAAGPSGGGKAQTIEVSPIEKMLATDSLSAEKAQPQSFAVGQVSQFGYDFFRPDAAGFAPLLDIPVGPDYMIGVGDRIVLTLWGSVNGRYELEVNRNGELTLPRVGTVNLAGVNYGQLQQIVRAHLAREFKDFQLNVSIGKLRLIKVYLVGEVRNPGDCNLSSLSTLINALSAAGGPTKNGSLRNIQIKRNGKTVENVDLYDFFLKGDKSRDVRLQSGDAVFVPTIGPVAGVAGNVRKPAIYELKDEKILKDLLVLADGINPGGYLQRIHISRLIAHEKKIVTDFNLDPAKTGKSTDELTGSIPV